MEAIVDRSDVENERGIFIGYAEIAVSTSYRMNLGEQLGC
jgi:hypothetical protein